MPNYNRAILAGHLTRDVDMRHSKGGSSFAKFGMAVTTKSRDRESTLFIDVTVFGRTAEVANEYLKKGSAVLVDGRLQTEEWEDKTSGQKRSKISFVCDSLQMLGGGHGGRSNSSQIDAEESPF